MVGVTGTITLLPEARAALDRRRRESRYPEIWDALDAVPDPEIPVINIWELGVLQDVRRTDTALEVVITPTYSGCPALQQMRDDIRNVLSVAGFSRIVIQTRLSPAWTTDWLNPATRQKLRDYGIAAPGALACPQCGSTDTQRLSEFGSTACKALYRCRTCLEPFDYFKAL